MRRAEIWEMPHAGTRVRVLVLSPADINATYRVVAALKLVAPDAPDTVLSVPLGGAAGACAFILNIVQLRAERFAPAAEAIRIGSASDAEMARVDNALRIALGL